MQNSRLCEKHFLPHDFQGDRQNKTCGHQKKRGELKKKKLKTGVIPSVWPNLPHHLSREPVTPRPTNATSTSQELLNTAREADSFNSLTELVEKFPLDDMRYIVINPFSPSYKYPYFPEPYLRFFTYKKENAIVGLIFIC